MSKLRPVFVVILFASLTLPLMPLQQLFVWTWPWMARRFPMLATDKPGRADRAGKVLIDWRQNDPNRSTIAPWSLRATPVPLVSAPVEWEELEHPERLAFTPAEALDRLRRNGDACRAVLELVQRL